MQYNYPIINQNNNRWYIILDIVFKNNRVDYGVHSIQIFLHTEYFKASELNSHGAATLWEERNSQTWCSDVDKDWTIKEKNKDKDLTPKKNNLKRVLEDKD